MAEPGSPSEEAFSFLASCPAEASGTDPAQIASVFPAPAAGGKGETVVQETTSAQGDLGG
jgi:hypothetical protein